MLNNHGWLPKQWSNLSRYEKALVIASINVKVEQEKAEMKRAERQAKAK
ncbi:hypothetical protein [Leuconostoc carnosum]|nr:hypothetical protein [Leuconostoc carnosum]